MISELDKARFWSRVLVKRRDECWPWQGGTTDGYGIFALQGRDYTAHRVALAIINELDLEDVPEIVHHKCRNPECCNASSHLEGHTRSSHPDAAPSWQSAKTHCPQGHPYSGDNLRIVKRSDGKTSRSCKACEKESNKRYEERKGGDANHVAQASASN